MTTTRWRALGDRLADATSACTDLDDLAHAVFDTVAAYVPFVFACLASIDPASGIITRPVKSHPMDLGDEDFAAAEYGEPDVNQFPALATRPVPVGALSVDTDGRPEQCRRFREYMAPVFGFTDELRLVCRARNVSWAALALYRGPGDAAFTPAEADLLGGVHEIVADAVQRTLFAGRPGATPAAPAAVIIVAAAGRATDVTAAARAHVEDLGGWHAQGSLPGNVLAVAAAARASGEPAGTRVLGRSGRWLALHAMPLDGAGSSRSVVITVDAAPPAAIGQLALAARGLTTREQDVAQLVLQGASTRAIAGTLFLSPHTVQDHLKAIFRKLGVTSRREMIALLVLPG